MNIKYSLPKKIENDLILLAKKYSIEKLVLFGSRARGDNRSVSDIDLAVSGGDVSRFRCDVDDEIETLLMFDIVNLDEPIQQELINSIESEGVIIYEKI